VPPRDAGRLPRLQGRKAAPPCWGDRRIGAYVHCVAGVAGKQKRGLRVLREPHLVVKPNPQLKAKRTPSRSTPGPPTSQEWWGIAMTTVMGEGVGWGAIVLALDGYPQQLVGDDAGVPWTARHGLAALALAA
jgi:hypothetical protein